MILKKLALCLLVVLLFSQTLHAEAQPVRLKDIGKIIEDRGNQLLGFGLVVGLRGSGDSRASLFTTKALTNLLKKLGITPDEKDYSSRNVAAVMVTTTLPAFVKKGQQIPVVVSSIGDSTSLVGGTLLLTQLQGSDLVTYAVAQGPIVVGGFSEQTSRVMYSKNQSTVGSIPQGAIVETEIPTTLLDSTSITIVLNRADFLTASRAAKAIQNAGFPGAVALDSNTIRIPVPILDSTTFVDTVARLESIKFVPDSSSKIVVNSKTGTIVIGEMVRLSPVAITHGNISVKIADPDEFGYMPIETTEAPLIVKENASKLIYLKPDSTLSSLVKALNDIGATPKDLISIIQALKEAGALVATIEVL